MLESVWRNKVTVAAQLWSSGNDKQAASKSEVIRLAWLSNAAVKYSKYSRKWMMEIVKGGTFDTDAPAC